MQRRKFVLGLGSLTAAGAAAVGSGAFSTAEATRDATVEVADDSTGYLALKQSGGSNGQFATEDGNGALTLDFSGSGNGGTGVGQNSVYNFDDVFTVTNQGTQTVYVWATFSGGSTFDDDTLYFYPNGSRSTELNNGAGSGGSSNDDVLGLAPGESAEIGVHVDTSGLSTGLDTITATFRADVEKGSSDQSNPVDFEGEDFLVVAADGSGDFSSISNAVSSVGETTIVVESGTYTEQVTLDVEGLTVRTDGSRPAIDASSKSGQSEAALTITADDVTVDGFEIRNAGNLLGIDIAAGVDGTTISNNLITDVGPTGSLGVTGINFQPGDHSNVTIVDNRIEDLIQTTTGFATLNGILIDGSSGSETLSDTVIARNTITALESDVAPLGIVVGTDVQNVRVEDNEFSDLRAANSVGSSTSTTFAQGMSIDPVDITDFEIVGNTFENVVSENGFFAEDIKIEDGAEVGGIDIRDNDFLSAIGVNNGNGSNPTVLAENNYWGGSGGPLVISSNDGDGDVPTPSGGSEVDLNTVAESAVTPNVNFDPFDSSP